MTDPNGQDEPAPAGKPPAKKTPVKKAPAKAAKKSPVKKIPDDKTPAKTAPTKKAVKKAPVKKVPGNVSTPQPALEARARPQAIEAPPVPAALTAGGGPAMPAPDNTGRSRLPVIAGLAGLVLIALLLRRLGRGSTRHDS